MEHSTHVPSNQQNEPLIGSNVDVLLDSKIVIAGVKPSDVEFMKTMLQISGFSNLISRYDRDGVMECLRHGIVGDSCDIDLLVIDTNLTDLSIHELRTIMDEFDEWRLIPIISLTQESQWDHAQLITDLGHSVTSLFYHPLTAESFPPAVMTALAVKRERDAAYQHRINLEDELAKLKVMEARLQFLVGHDDLTGLLNRRQFETVLDLKLTQVRNFNTTAALLYVDVDRFKVLNDAVGHQAGDALLVQISDELRRYFSVSDTLVRIGSDEFAILVENIDCDEAIDIADKLRELFDGYVFEHHAHNYHLSVSIGVKFVSANGPHACVSSGDVLAHANQACYTAKIHGRNRVNLYSSQDTEMTTLRHNVEWAPRIRKALQQENFLLVFQPIHSVETGAISHYECLIRMRADNITYYPDDFIPVAETMGLIHQIDLWVVNHAFDLVAALPEHIALTINLSGNIFLDRNLYPLIENKLIETGVNPTRVIFEITETSAISNFEKTKEMVVKLRSLGCSFALDDFGSGFNSYNYLKQFPVDILKIDGSFITDLLNDSVDQLLVKSMIDVAHDLGKKTVAEFVEDEDTMALLVRYGVDYIQGYLVGTPQDELPIN
jgi:diguanylate cyclase (GGDEF)-like protein